MAIATSSDLTDYYAGITRRGHLRTPDHARRWSAATLGTLGQELDRGTKKALTNALPAGLGGEVGRIFWLLHFREGNLSAVAFQQRVARRAGASDPQFAQTPIMAVFAEVKRLIPDDVSQRVAGALSPEVRQLWAQA